ncbi:MAG: hypothetical protein WED10_12610 [Brumimicrobium sp.]
MKSIIKGIFALTMVLSTITLFGQAPEKMSYQAVVRDINDNLLNAQAVGTQITIIQGSVTGTEVYQETHTPTTNANGLVSLEIGTGTAVSGSFNTIDWADGPYYVKSETDPTGGTNYTIEITNQLMSVPYALHATTADSLVSGATVTEVDPLFSGSVAAGIVEADTANWNNHTDSTDVAQMGYTAGLKTYEVGDYAQGGVVFWVDETKQHGLVCTTEDVIPGTIRWFAGTHGSTRAVGDGAFGGEDNTNLILSAQINLGDDGADYAAAICSDLVVSQGGVDYGDWYLPTVEELYLIGQNYTIVDNTSTANGGTALVTSPYWSSMELNNNDAKYVVITPGGVSDSSVDKAATFNVRAVRAF